MGERNGSLGEEKGPKRSRTAEGQKRGQPKTIKFLGKAEEKTYGKVVSKQYKVKVMRTVHDDNGNPI